MTRSMQCKTLRRWITGSVLGAASLVLSQMTTADSGLRPAARDTHAAQAVQVDADGTVHVPPISVPVSSFLTPQGKTYLTQHLKDMQVPASKVLPADGLPFFLEPYLARDHTLFAVEQQDTMIGGVHVRSYVPKAGLSSANEHRVLIDLHGGGFAGCFPGCADLESLPIAALGRFRILSPDYRQSPRYHFPAASEDVAALYRELLKTYPPESIGLYGCSAGGMLVGMSVAWFQAHGLPRPGAIGIFCAGMTVNEGARGFGGDAEYTTAAIGEAHPPAEPPPPRGTGLPGLAYLSGVDVNDPLVAPARSDAVLAKFPPTLIITGTRGFELSSAVYSHSRLVRMGVEAELHVWEGLFHGFFYNPDVPESQDCYRVIIGFFDRHLKG